MTLTNLEKDVLGFMLAGNHPVLKILRDQVAHSTVIDRDFTGVGFFTEFDATGQSSIPRKERHVITGVFMRGTTSNGFSPQFMLFVNNGYIDTLEGHQIDGWSPPDPYTLEWHMKDMGGVLDPNSRSDALSDLPWPLRVWHRLRRLRN